MAKSKSNAKKQKKTEPKKQVKKSAKTAKVSKKDSEKKPKKKVKVEEPETKTKKSKKGDKPEALKKTRNKNVIEAPSLITSSKSGLVKLPDLIMSESFRDLSTGFDSIEDKLACHSVYLKASSHVKNALSTGILHYDLALGGGFAPGKMSVEYGPEMSAKSTRQFTAICAAVLARTMPIVHDAESALNAGYIDRILLNRTGMKLDDLVGEQSADGNWIRNPYMRYYNETIGEKVFRHIKRTLDLLPDVVENRAGEFFKVYRNKKGDILKTEQYDGSAQAAYFVDSAAALIPESKDENDEANAMAAAARMFAWGFPLIKGRVAAKRVVLFFTNQVRNRPGQSMGDPRYMPGGATFAHNNDCRSFAEPRHPKSKEMGMDAKSGENFSREKSIDGGEDKYHYQRIRTEKNKQFIARRAALMRTRLEHNGKPGDGICETFDTFQYLRSTGQLTKRGETIILNVEGTAKAGKVPDLLGANGTKINWLTFKKLVELPENKRLLQKHCSAQLKSGYAFQLENQAQSKGLVSTDDSDDE